MERSDDPRPREKADRMAERSMMEGRGQRELEPGGCDALYRLATLSLYVRRRYNHCRMTRTLRIRPMLLGPDSGEELVVSPRMFLCGRKSLGPAAAQLHSVHTSATADGWRTAPLRFTQTKGMLHRSSLSGPSCSDRTRSMPVRGQTSVGYVTNN